MFSNGTQTPSRKNNIILSGQSHELVVSGPERRGGRHCAAELYYKSRLFLELPPSSSPLLSQPGFLFEWWLSGLHFAWSPSLKARVSLLRLSPPSPSQSHLLPVETSVPAAGGSQCA